MKKKFCSFFLFSIVIVISIFFLFSSKRVIEKHPKVDPIPLEIRKIMATYQIEDQFYYDLHTYSTFKPELFVNYYLESQKFSIPINYIYLLNKVNYPHFLSFNGDVYPKINYPILFVNPKFYLDSDYVPPTLIKVAPFDHIIREETMHFSKEIVDNYQLLYNFLVNNNTFVTIFSAYRSFAYQKNLYQEDNPFIAKPGHSEHQTGLAVDISTLDYGLSVNMVESEAYRLLSENAYQFGFILRYPQDKEKLTGYPFEPWHYRYVGKDIAKKMYEEKLCLEEYFYRYVLLDY